MSCAAPICWRCCASAAPPTRRGRGWSKLGSTAPTRSGATICTASGRAGAPPPRGGADITIDEAYAILGLRPGADAAAIKAAHHRLMKQLHPDHGGTDYFAAKLNRARDVLLNR